MFKRESEGKGESMKEQNSYNSLSEKAVKMKLIMYNYPKAKIIWLHVRAGKLLKFVICSECAIWGQEGSVWQTGFSAPQVNYCLFEMPHPWKIISTLKKCLYLNTDKNPKGGQRMFVQNTSIYKFSF